MNQQHKDILTIIERHGPIATSEICEQLSTLGYGGAMAWQDFRDVISKQVCYLRDKGDITGEDRPQPKGKPLRFWSLAKAEEMASDVTEVQVNDDAKWEAFKGAYKDTDILMKDAPETLTSDPVSVDVKVEHKPRLSAEQLIQGYKDAGSQGNMLVFAAGVAFAEKHHGISQ